MDLCKEALLSDGIGTNPCGFAGVRVFRGTMTKQQQSCPGTCAAGVGRGRDHPITFVGALCRRKETSF